MNEGAWSVGPIEKSVKIFDNYTVSDWKAMKVQTLQSERNDSTE